MHKESEILPPKKREHVERRQQRHPVAGILRRGDESFFPSHSSHTSVSHVTRTHHQRTSSSAHHRSNKNLWSSKIWIGSPSPRSQIALEQTISKRDLLVHKFQCLWPAFNYYSWYPPHHTATSGWCPGVRQWMRFLRTNFCIHVYQGSIDPSITVRRAPPIVPTWKIEPFSLSLSQIGFLNYS